MVLEENRTRQARHWRKPGAGQQEGILDTEKNRLAAPDAREAARRFSRAEGRAGTGKGSEVLEAGETGQPLAWKQSGETERMEQIRGMFPTGGQRQTPRIVQGDHRGTAYKWAHKGK